jgi:diaminopimelate epimerase
MKIEFTKMHGLGNDFILIDGIKNQALTSFCDEELSTLSIFLCKRRFGVGADQLLLLVPSEKADFRMRIFNADGSEVEMCGNGIRCFAKYIWDSGLSDKDILEVETMAGMILPEKRGDQVRVNMGLPRFRPDEIPLYAEGMENLPGDEIIDFPLEVEGETFRISCLSMGNPHTVIVVDDVKTFPVSYFGPMIENHQIFPRRTNVEFVEIMNNGEVRMRVWERGAGETMACGTGASATAVITARKGLTGREVNVHLLGGELFIEWADDGHVYMTGPAITVFDGVIRYNYR